MSAISRATASSAFPSSRAWSRAFRAGLQIQEKLTADIAETIQEILNPVGVGVVIEAEHSCMTLRGVNTPGSRLSTSRLLGAIRDDPRTRSEFLRAVGGV